MEIDELTQRVLHQKRMEELVQNPYHIDPQRLM